MQRAGVLLLLLPPQRLLHAQNIGAALGTIIACSTDCGMPAPQPALQVEGKECPEGTYCEGVAHAPAKTCCTMHKVHEASQIK